MAARLFLQVDGSAMEAPLALLLEHLPQLAPEVRERVLDRLDAFAQAGCIDVETFPALRTGEVRVALQPTDAFLDLVAAVRAGNVDLL